jgi:hypothetical protein
VRGSVPDLPPRFLVSASSYALATGRVAPQQLSQQVIAHLTRLNPRRISNLEADQAAVVA